MDGTHDDITVFTQNRLINNLQKLAISSWAILYMYELEMCSKNTEVS
jgi:hypothetical protein